MAAGDTLKEGFLTKQGGGYRSWKIRWCVLREESLSYYVNQDDEKPKKTIDLREGLGVRTKDHCSMEDWPGDATYCFGLATSKRTWYFYGSDEKDTQEWSELIQQCIEKVGQPSEDWENDLDDKPEGMVSKALRATTKQAIKQAKSHIPKTGNKYADAVIKGAFNMAENQVDADPHTSMKGRLKMAGGNVIGGVTGTVNNPIVSAVGSVAKDQLEADEDLSVNQRLALAGGSAIEGAGDVTKIDAMKFAGKMMKDQATADKEDVSMREELTTGMKNPLGGIKDLKNIRSLPKAIKKGIGKNITKKGAMKVAGKMLKDQATADEEDDSMSEELTAGAKNPLDSIKGLKNDPVARNLPKVIKKGIGKGITKKIDAKKIAGKMLKDQATADEEDDSMSKELTTGVKDPLGGIKGLKNDPVARSLPKAIKKGIGKGVTKKIDAKKIAGKMMKDQATADEEDVSMGEDLTIGVKDPSDGITDLKNDPIVHSIPKEVKKGVGKSGKKVW